MCSTACYHLAAKARGTNCITAGAACFMKHLYQKNKEMPKKKKKTYTEPKQQPKQPPIRAKKHKPHNVKRQDEAKLHEQAEQIRHTCRNNTSPKQNNQKQ